MSVRRELFQKSEALLKALLQRSKVEVDSDVRYLVEAGGDHQGGHDYAGSWMAVGDAIDSMYPVDIKMVDESQMSHCKPGTPESTRDSFSGTVSFEGQESRQAIMERHQKDRNTQMFKSPQITRQSTKMLDRIGSNMDGDDDDEEEDIKAPKRMERSRSWCIAGASNRCAKVDEKLHKEQPVKMEGVNWVCLHNTLGNGLNGACMRLAGTSPLINIRTVHGFNMQQGEVSTHTKVLRNVNVDNDDVEHDEKRIYFIDKGPKKERILSPWHDISVVCEDPPAHIKKNAGLLCNMIVEIPRFSSAKMEISTNMTHNPIVQDKDKYGRDRYYPGPIMWNYGAFPQTWEDPKHGGDEEVHFAYGDGDPLDVVDVSRKPSREFVSGDVVPVRILGVLPMLDGGGTELDWKTIAINAYDEHFCDILDLQSLEQTYPHTLNGVREWFRWYKYSGPNSKLNDFGYMGLVLCRCDAEDILANTHEQWERLQDSCYYKTKHLANLDVQERKLHLMKEFEMDIWHPVHLRADTKAYKDRYG